jgi:dephospho-CoA kinase
VRTLRVGLTGGIGSGKSAVAQIWREFGAAIIDADAIAREVVAPGTEGLALIAARWPGAIAGDGTLDRGLLAAIVFRDDAARAELNAITHPRVRARADAIEAEAPPGTVVVHVIPLLFEGNFWTECDATVLVVAPRETRVARVISRDGVTEADVERRMRAQIDPDEARKRASYTIENDGDRELLYERSLEVYVQLLAMAA